MQRFVALILIAAAARGGSPTLEGAVFDANGYPAPGAKIACGAKYSIAGADGRFSLAGADACSASVSAPGFETARVDLRAGAPAEIRLALAPLPERIVVSATRLETSVEEAAVSASVVSAEALEQRQDPPVLDVLRELPGLHVAKFGRHGASTQVFARGGQRTGTLVLIDGVPANDPGGDLNFAHLLSSSIGRMEVVRGPESALFGADASAAVIQLFTRQGRAEETRPRATLSYERGSFQTDRWIANLSGGSGARFDYALGAEQFHTVSEFPNDFYRNTTGSASFGYRLSDATRLRATLRSFDTAVGVPNRTAYNVFDFDANRRNRDYLAGFQVDDVRGRSFAQRASFSFHKLRDTFDDQVRDGPYTVAALVTGASQVRLVELIDPRRLPLAPAEIPPGARLAVRTNIRLAPASSLSVTSRERLTWQGTASQTHGAAVFGYEFERKNGSISGRGVDRGNHGWFAHRQHTFFGRVFVSGGARVEQNSVFGAKFTPRAALSVRALPNTFLRVSAGRGITEPSLLQNFARESTFVGNPALRPEKTVSYETGIVQTWFGKRLRTEVSAFHNGFQDLIVFLSLPAQTVSTWSNVEASRARGAEFSGEAKLLRHITLAGHYTLLSTRILVSNAPASPVTGVGQELLRRPRHSGAVSLTVAPRRWFFEAGAVFMGERQDMDGAGLGLTRNPAYQSVSAGGSYRLNARLSPMIRVENLLNRRYQEVFGYSSLSRAIRGGVRLSW
jgi:vitamin B12 transporter